MTQELSPHVEAEQLAVPEALMTVLPVSNETLTSYRAAVEAVVTLLNEDATEVTGEILEQAEVDPEALSREQGRSLQGEVFNASSTMLTVCGRTVAGMAPEERVSAAYGSLRPYFAPGEQIDAMVRIWADVASEYADRYVQIEHHSYETASNITTALQDDAAAQYELIKTLVAPGILVGELTAETKVTPETAFRLMLYFEQAARGKDTLPVLLLAQLQAGAYDTFLAREVLQHLETTEGAAHSQAERLRSMWQLVQFCAPEVPTETLRERLITAQVHWPSEAKLGLSSLRTRLAEELEMAAGSSKKYLVEAGLLPKTEGQEESLEQAIKDYLGAMARHPMFRQQYHKQFTRQQIVRAAVEQKRRRRARRAPEPLPEEKAAASSEMQRQPRQLVVYDDEGSVHGRDSERFKQKVQAYLDSHKGAIGLEQDVQRILKYVAALDFSHGLVKGVTKYQPHQIKIGGQDYNLYGLKPSDAVGLPTSSKRAKKIRVLFTLTEDQAGLIAIAERDSISGVEKDLGIPSGAR